MKEFLFLIRAIGSPVADLPFKEQQRHINKVGLFINSLKEKGVLISAQPLEDKGLIVSNQSDNLVESDFKEGEETIVGYYLLKLESMDEALTIARSDPRFDDGKWRVEVRPIMILDGLDL